jgi:hypothetical protein
MIYIQYVQGLCQSRLSTADYALLLVAIATTAVCQNYFSLRLIKDMAWHFNAESHYEHDVAIGSFQDTWFTTELMHSYTC